jgi:CRISPR/Cas system-associated protein endoribonuclease Cas2
MDKNHEPIFELKIDQQTEDKLRKSFRKRVRKAKFKLKILSIVKKILKF